jgi:aryl-alcohol dehydrogenase-like predicted oxidoreductase
MTMELRNLGRSGLRVSLVGLGCNNFGGRIDNAAARAVIDKAIDSGITLFDTADTYGNRGGAKGDSERALGELLGERRKQIVLATKFCSPMDEARGLMGASRRYIMSAVEASLTRLRTDWIDLYQIHRPDPLTPIEETLRALDDLVRQGKVRYIGCSNFAAWQLVEAAWTAKSAGLHGFVSYQDEYSLVVRKHEKELMPAAQEYGLGMLPYFPLASGLLTGKYRRDAAPEAGTRFAASFNQNLTQRYMTPANFDKVEALQTFVAARGRTMLELAFSWLAQRPTVASVIAGATSAQQIEQNIKAVGWILTPEERAEVEKITA